MKTLYSLLAVSFLLFAGTAIAQTGNGAQKSETIKVWGNCGMCKKNIETAAKDAGATAAAWDKTTKMLAVKYSADQTSSLKIQEKIAAAGYDTRDLLGNDEAYKNLEECCQYKRKAAPAKAGEQAMQKACCSKENMAKANCMKGSADCCKNCTATASKKDCSDCCAK